MQLETGITSLLRSFSCGGCYYFGECNNIKFYSELIKPILLFHGFIDLCISTTKNNWRM
jgi:hypothetical protein